MTALEMISNGNAPIKQVASRLGFSSVSAFSHAFRQVTGSRPGELSTAARRE
jgi:AraC-like DNA-binding protein